MSEGKAIYGYFENPVVKPTVQEVSYFDNGSEVVSPISATEVFQVRVRFAREMEASVEPTVWLTSTGAKSPTVPTGGTWENILLSGDAYRTPVFGLSGDHIGTVTVGVSGGQAYNGVVMSANEAADLFTLKAGGPTGTGFVINEGAEYINRPNVAVKWSAVGASHVWISGDVVAADNTHQWIPTNVSGDSSTLGSGDVVLNSDADGLKTVYAKFKTASGDESVFGSDYIVLDRSGDAITDVACSVASGGAAIGNASWTTDDQPYFSWSAPSSASPIRGYAYALTSGDGSDAALPDTVNLSSGDIHVDYTGDPITPGKHKFIVKAQDKANNWGSGDQFDYWLASGDSFHIPGRIRMWEDSGQTYEITDGMATASGDGSPYIAWNDPQSPGDDTFYINTSGDNVHETNYEFSTTDPNYTFTTSLGVGLTRILMRPITGLGISGDIHEFSFAWTSGDFT